MSNLPRIAPVEPPFSPEMAEMLSKWMGKGVTHPPLALFRTLVKNLELSGRMFQTGAGLLGRSSTLDPKDRELVIDRTCARCGCEYEWGVHVALFVPLLKLDEATMRATATASPDDTVWTPRQDLLIRLVDELHDTAHISDGLWDALKVEWNEAQCLELLVLVGWYHLISFVANGLNVTPEPWAAHFVEQGEK